MKLDFRNLFKSFLFFAKARFQEHHYDVVFYYPCHFNRGDAAHNSLFSPLYELCKKNGIKYIILEEPDLQSSFPRNPHAVPFDFPFLIIILLRKLIPLNKFDSFQHRDWYLANKLKPWIFKQFHFKSYIVLSNSMLAFFRGLEKNAQLFDYQHGVVFSGHKGYFSEADNSVAEHIKFNNVNLLLYGQSFQKLLTKNDKEGYYRHHTYVLGIKDRKILSKPSSDKSYILFSLQFTEKGTHPHKQYAWLKAMDQYFEQNSDFFIKNGLTILLKHHPRYDGSIDISPLFKHTFVQLFKGTLEEGLKKSFLHMTFYSTTVFDASHQGIPTILWQHKFSLANIYIDDFDYPLGIDMQNTITHKIQKYKQDEKFYNSASEKVKVWYLDNFNPLNEEFFLQMVKKT